MEVDANKNYRNVCRVCISTKDNQQLQIIFVAARKRAITLAEMLSTCTGNTIEQNDGLPSRICSECVVYLDMAYDFLVLCQTSEATLRTALNVAADDVGKEQINRINVKEETVDLDENERRMDNCFIKNELDNEAQSSGKNCSKSDELSVNNERFDENLDSNEINPERVHVIDRDPLDLEFVKIETVFENDCSASANTVVAPSIDNSQTSDIHIISDNSDASDIEDEIFPLIDVVDVVDLDDSESDDAAAPSATDIITEPEKYSAEKAIGSKTDGIFKRRELLKSIFDKLPMVLNRKRLTNVQQNTRPANNKCKEIKANKYACHYCSEMFTEINDIKEHIRTHREAVEFCPTEHPSTSNEIKNIKYICKFCNRSFQYLHQLKVHTKIHFKLPANNFQCRICKKTFKKKHYLKDHLLRHKGIKNFVCPVCERRFVNRNELRKHIDTHSKIKKYKCDGCASSFTHPYILETHKERFHRGKGNYECEVCHRRFTNRIPLKIHLRLHTGEKPFICNLCDEAFVASKHLNNHVRTTHLGEIYKNQCDTPMEGVSSKSDEPPK